MIFNKFTIDEERRLAIRQELKRKLAEAEVKRQRVAELQAIVDKLAADSDAAADEHSEAASKLQDELDELDQAHVSAILAGKTSPAKAMTRRREILDELASLNQALETRCEANKRATLPITRDIDKLQMELAEGSAIKSQLASLCSVETRQQRLLNSHRLQFLTHAMNDARRMAAITRVNVDRATIEKRGDAVTIQRAKSEDYESMVVVYAKEIAAIHANDKAIEAKALAE